MAGQQYVGFVYDFDPISGGRKVEVTSGGAADVDEATEWCKREAAKKTGEAAWEVWRSGGGKEYLCLVGSASPKARHYHLSNRKAVEIRNDHLRLHREAAEAVKPVPAAEPPEEVQSWMDDGGTVPTPPPVAEKPTGENMAYMVLIFGYPVNGSAEPTFLRALPYVDVGTLAETIQHWQATSGGTWIRETWALWDGNERMLESSSSDPHWPAIHAGSKIADQFREMVAFSTRLCMGMIPPPTLDELNRAAHKVADKVVAEAVFAADQFEPAKYQYDETTGAAVPCKPCGHNPLNRREDDPARDCADPKCDSPIHNPPTKLTPEQEAWKANALAKIAEAEAAGGERPKWLRPDATPEEFQAGLQKAGEDFARGVQVAEDVERKADPNDEAAGRCDQSHNDAMDD